MDPRNFKIIVPIIFILLLLCAYAVSDAQACVDCNFVKIVIKEKDGVVSKEEELYCSDGRKGIDTPSYWELFAQFYYRDVATPEYCRYYSRKNHAFKSFGKACLNENGEWKVK